MTLDKNFLQASCVVCQLPQRALAFPFPAVFFFFFEENIEDIHIFAKGIFPTHPNHNNHMKWLLFRPICLDVAPDPPPWMHLQFPNVRFPNK